MAVDCSCGLSFLHTNSGLSENLRTWETVLGVQWLRIHRPVIIHCEQEGESLDGGAKEIRFSSVLAMAPFPDLASLGTRTVCCLPDLVRAHVHGDGGDGHFD